MRGVVGILMATIAQPFKIDLLFRFATDRAIVKDLPRIRGLEVYRGHAKSRCSFVHFEEEACPA